MLTWIIGSIIIEIIIIKSDTYPSCINITCITKVICRTIYFLQTACTLSQFQAADYDSIADETLYDFNEVYSSGMVSLLNKMNAIYQLFGKPVFLLALLALLVLTVRVIHGLFHGDRTDLELWILSCGILLSAVLLRFGCGLFTGWFTDDMQKFINSFYSCGVYILLQLFKYLAIGTIYEGGITYGKFEGTDSGIAKDH